MTVPKKLWPEWEVAIKEVWEPRHLAFFHISPRSQAHTVGWENSRLKQTSTAMCLQRKPPPSFCQSRDNMSPISPPSLSAQTSHISSLFKSITAQYENLYLPHTAGNASEVNYAFGKGANIPSTSSPFILLFLHLVSAQICGVSATVRFLPLFLQ